MAISRLLRAGAYALLICAVGGPFGGCAAVGSSSEASRAARAKGIRGTRATYCSAPRKSDGRVDVEKLFSELVDVHANTYSFCIHSAATDWQDLMLILPRARKEGIRIWASIVPPSESPPRVKLYAEPFRLDYQKWAVEFARLSRREPSLVAWSIDDFTHNLKFFTPAYVKGMIEGARKVNPQLAFVPCCYYPAITPQFATNYGAYVDGILFPYRHESGGANLQDPSLVESELLTIRERVGTTLPIVLDIYASAHSRLGATTPEYLEKALTAGKRAADGVMIYRHQDPRLNSEKFEIVKRLFSNW